METIKYTIGEDVDKIIKSAIYNSKARNVDFQGPEPKKFLVIKSGMAGVQQLNDAIMNMAVQSGLVINASELGAISGKLVDPNEGYTFTSYTIPFLVNVRVVMDPNMDPAVADNRSNPYIKGYRKSSYNYQIFDGDTCIVTIIAKKPGLQIRNRLSNFFLKPVYSYLDVLIFLIAVTVTYDMKLYYRALAIFIALFVISFTPKLSKRL